jgi:hypothetical protein
VDWVITYVGTQKFFTQTVNVTPPATNTSAIKIYQAIDTFLGGSDQGPAYSLEPELAVTGNVTGDPSFVGVRKNVGTATEAIVGFVEISGGTQFSRYYSGDWSGGGLYNGMATGGDIVNTFTTAPTTDNGIGVQFNLNTPTAPTAISYRLAFDGDTKLDLDANNSTTTGNNYIGTFTAVTGSPISVVDSDMQITNIIGNISDATVTLTNLQAGDVLTIDSALLPPGILVEAKSANTITLSGSGTSANYEAAIKLIQFSTTSAQFDWHDSLFNVERRISANAGS